MKSGTHNYDLVNNAKRQYTIKNIKDAEFFTLSPQSSAIILKTGENSVDVIDGDSMDRVFSMKTTQAKCVHLCNKQIFVGQWNA
jgi:hypothetical protein